MGLDDTMRRQWWRVISTLRSTKARDIHARAGLFLILQQMASSMYFVGVAVSVFLGQGIGVSENTSYSFGSASSLLLVALGLIISLCRLVLKFPVFPC